MFVAIGLDMSSEPCPLVVIDKRGQLLEHRCEERPIDCIVSYLEYVAYTRGKITFCAISGEDAYEFECHYCRRLRERKVYIKIYDPALLVQTENMLTDLQEGVPRRAYCLARLVQSEALHLFTCQEKIRKLYNFRETLDQLLIHLSLLYSFPDDCHLLDRWRMFSCGTMISLAPISGAIFLPGHFCISLREKFLWSNWNMREECSHYHSRDSRRCILTDAILHTAYLVSPPDSNAAIYR